MTAPAGSTAWDLQIGSVDPRPVDEAGLRRRLLLTLVAAGQLALGIPAIPLLVLTIVAIPLGPLGVGLLLAHAVVPATEWLVRAHRELAGRLLGEELPTAYAATDGRGPLGRPLAWLRDPARWRDVALLAFSATGGAVLSLVVLGLLVQPAGNLLGLVLDGGWVWFWLAFLLGPVAAVAWWVVAPVLVRARALAERGILGGETARLERRVEEVESSRAETLDHSAAEVRRIERDLHDGAQARIVSVGMNVGLAEKLIDSDPEAAARLLREAREATVSALDELRSVVRGIHPPVLADRGLAGAVEALAVPMPLPVTVALDLPRVPAPVESAAYFAVAECFANIVKHAAAQRAWVRGSHDGEMLRLVVGDDGHGGADPSGSGLGGVSRRLAAFDGTMTVESPTGGPTVVTLEVPCAQSSPRTTPSSGRD